MPFSDSPGRLVRVSACTAETFKARKIVSEIPKTDLAFTRGIKRLHNLLQLLLDNGADANVADYDGRTALHVAASEGHEACVQLLLQAGAKKSLADRWGNTAGADATRCGYKELAEKLVA